MHHKARVLALVMAAGALTPAASRAADPVARFSAFAVDLGGATRRGGAGTVDIVVDRWSTAQERANLMTALREDGSGGLLKALRKMDDVGRIRGGANLGYPLRFAQEIPLAGGGRRVLIATDRPVSFLELRARPRTVDEYPFMVVDMRLGPQGEGEGKLLPVASIRLHPDHVIDIENYLDQPVRLTRVRQVD
jgi:hypothetical protein